MIRTVIYLDFLLFVLIALYSELNCSATIVIFDLTPKLCYKSECFNIYSTVKVLFFSCQASNELLKVNTKIDY